MNAETMPAGGLVPDSTYVDIDKVPWLKTRFPGIETRASTPERRGSTTSLAWLR